MLLSNAPQLTVLNAGTYVVEVDSNGCTGVDTIVITQHPLPVVDITASPNTSFCPGDMVTLDATPGFVTYLWSTGDTTASIMTGLPGTYDVTVADSNGCMAMANISLIQFPQPTVQIVALPDSNFCPGDSVLLLTNPGNFVGYQWSTGDTTASLTVRQPGNIIVTVTDVNGCSATDSIQINQYPQPVVDIVGDTAFCSGDSVVLSTNPANFTDYNWSTGALTPSITVTSGGTYSVQVTDANGCVAADTVIVTENTLPGVNITASPDTAFCPGDIVTLSATPGLVSYLWSTGDTTNSIQTGQPGGYTVAVTDGNGCVGTDSITLVQYPQPSVQIVALPDSNFCPGDSVLLLTNPGNFASYLWSTGATTASLTVKQPGNIIVTVTDVNGCSATDSILINQYPQPTVDIVGDTAFCSGDSVILSTNPANFTDYNWSTGALTPSITVTSGGTYSVQVTDANGCVAADTVIVTENTLPGVNITASPDTAFCPGDIVTLSATPGLVSYLWSTGDTTNSIQTGQPGGYTVAVTDGNGCVGTDSITLVQYPQPSVQIVALPDSNFCPGDSVLLLTNPGNFASYLWSTGDTTASLTVKQPGNIIVTVTDVNGCSATDSILINQYPQPTVQIVGDTVFCSGDSVILSTNPANFTDYDWSTGALTPSITVTMGGQYAVTVTDANGCTVADTVTVTENPLPQPSISSAKNFVICTGQLDTLTVNPTFDAYLWSTGDTTQSIVVSMGGTYSVTVQDSNGCANADTVTVIENPLPQPTISVDPTVGFCIADTVFLKVDSTYASYSWSNGDTSQQTFVTAPAVYSVTVTDGNGCINSATVDLTIQPVDTQQIFIRQGWSIISSYLCLEQKDIDSIFTPIDTAIWIVKDEAGQAYLPNLVNSIGNWDLTKGYRVKAYRDTVLQLVGEKVDHTMVSLLLPSGWSLISYLRDSALAVAPALGTNVVNNLYLLKNQDGLAFIPSFSIDQIGSLVPGQGYWVKMITNDTLVYPARHGYFEDWYVRPLPAKHFNLPANTGENATLILPLDGLEKTMNPGDELGVFGPTGLLVGTGVYDGNNLALAIWGDDPTTPELDGLLPGESFTFKRWDVRSLREVEVEAQGYNTELTYQAEAIKVVKLIAREGTLVGNDRIEVYPNPASDRVHFDFVMEDAQEVKLRLFDMTGRLVHGESVRVEVGGKQLTVNTTQLARGTYTYTIEYGGGVKRGKLILE